jgi:hypothetical protein
VLHSIQNPLKERNLKEVNYEGIAVVKILSIETVKKFHFYHTGNEFLIDSYIVSYNFKVGEQTYCGLDKIYPYKKFRGLISNLLKNGKVIAQYDITDPSKNILKR